MQVQQHAVAVSRGDRSGRDDERLDAREGRRLYGDAKRLTKLRESGDRDARGLLDPCLPFGRALGRDVEAGIERPGDDGLHLRTDGLRHRQHARGDLSRAEAAVRHYV
jgi:hypothetical protein